MAKLARLFWELFKISLFVIGGGYSIIVVADEVFSRLGWIKEGELIEHLPVFQTIPGLIATHTAVYVGNKMAGGVGALIGVVAVALPSIAIFSFVAAGYTALPLDNAWLGSAFIGLRAALTGIIAATIIRSWRRNLDSVFAYAVMATAMAALLVGVPITVVLAAAIILGMSLAFRPAEGGRLHAAAFILPLILFLKYGSLCFGGGFVLVPMYIEDFVGSGAKYLNISADEFSNLMALTQMTPGPIGINGATFFGFRFGGFVGSLLASAGLLLPGSLLAYFAIRSLERFRQSKVVISLMRAIRPASMALMLVALMAFSRMCLVDTEGDFHPLAAILVIMVAIMTLKKKLKVIALIVISALMATALRAEDDWQARFSDADTVTLNDIERVAYRPDGTYETTEEVWTKLLTEKGRREESVFSLSYSKRYGEAEIVFVKAVATNGVERVIDVSRTTSEATDNSSMAANIYDPLDRVITCTIPGLQVGETLHVKTRRRALKPRCEGMWADLSVMEWTHPILSATYEVTAPRERPLKKIAVRNPLGNVATGLSTNAEGSLVHVFTVTNSPQAFPEPEMPPLYTQVQNVRVSTAAGWPEVSKWYWELCAPHLAKTNAAMVAKVRELVAQSNQSEQSNNPNNRTISQIFKFVSQEVRYMGLTMEDTSPGYAPHDVDVTFDNRYGVCRDKAGLLVAMLRLAGFKAFPVLIHVGAKLDPEVPQPFFNHAIVAVEGVEGVEYLLMDPTNENTKDLFPSYLGNCSYLVARPEGEELKTSPVPPPEDNALDINSSAMLARDGSMFFESALDFRGINDTLYRGTLAKRTPEERVKTFERILKRISPGAELVKCEIEPREIRDTTKPLKVSLAAKFPEMIIRGETRDELTVPVISRQLGLANWLLEGNTALETRRFALKLDTTAAVRERLRIDGGGALGELVELPPGGKIDGGYGYDCAFAVTNGVVTMARTLSVGAVEFSPLEYSRLREDIKRVEAAERKKPVFKSDRLHDANVRQILDSSEMTLFSDCSWVTTNIDVTEVLTYKGKKDSAELRFSYHPSWKRIDILEATVSNRDGKVYAVSPKEVNEMDCGWAASAPRYPAGKIKVVNLPSVEIGSVITLKTVVTVTNAPAPFYACLYFDSYQPVDRLVRRVGNFKRDLAQVKRLPDEPSQPDGRLWRDHEIITRGNWKNAAENLRNVVEIPAIEQSEQSSNRTLKTIRDWMAMHVKVVGPSLYELPLDEQLTDPEVVLKERYATRLDYVRTLCALLRGAGYETDVVFAANNAKSQTALKVQDQDVHPNIRAYSLALCRVRVREGGLLGFGGEIKEYFIGTENEYTPIGATGYGGCDYFDPKSGEFGMVRNAEGQYDYDEKDEEQTEFIVRENGAVDISVKNLAFGAQVGEFRKRFEEMLPEMRSRFYQSLLGDIAQAASATSELRTDTKGYPAETTFSCYVPDYATVGKDTISIVLPSFNEVVPNLTGTTRETSVALVKTDSKVETVVVRFPEGYTEIEHLPESFVFWDDLQKFGLVANQVSSEVKDGMLSVKIVRETQITHTFTMEAIQADYLKALRRKSSSRANRTITVRRASRR